MIKFNDELHDELFKLFILASNGKLFFPWDRCQGDSAKTIFSLQYSDRSICEVEYDGFVGDMADDEEGFIYTLVSDKYIDNNAKIIFRFEE